LRLEDEVMGVQILTFHFGDFTKRRKMMKKKTILMLAFFTVLAFGVQAALAQMPINIPNIPKVKKNKPEQSKQDQQTTQETESPTNDTNQSNENKSDDSRKTENETQESEQDLPSGHPAFQMYFEEIQAALKEAEEYTPQSDRAIYSYSGKHDWGLIAVSASARNEWFEGYFDADWRKANPKNKVDAAFDKLAALIAKHMPVYKGDLSSYKLRNPADEKIMKTIFEDITRWQIYSYGIQESNWLIEKNDSGIPNARYKHAAFYLRDKRGDHPFCYLTYVNIIQDYSGGGTYAASRAKYIGDQLVGCPAGAK
jgi:hypothetical protein